MIRVINSDCLDALPKIASGSIDAVFTDPPYPEIDRDYGRIGESEWLVMMDSVMAEIRRIIVPSGSAIVVLQANSTHVGKCRTWLWKFLAKWGDEWGIVQDLYWWNTKAQPTVHAGRKFGLTRPSVKMLAWFGTSDCYRDQGVLMRPIAASTLSDSRRDDGRIKYQPSGGHVKHSRCIGTAVTRGKATPFNLFQFGNPGSRIHPGSTPFALTEQFVQYICPVGGTVLDPFAGSGTTGRVANSNQRSAVLIEQKTVYCVQMAKEFGLDYEQ